MTPREFIDFLHLAERLKDNTRHSTTSQGRPESVAEHSWRVWRSWQCSFLEKRKA